MSEEMAVFTRMFDLLAWLLPKAESFPRLYRTTLTQRMMDAALDLQERLIEAQNRRGKARREALDLADDALSSLRVYLRLAHQWHWLNDGQYHHVSHMLAEVGRLLGGWIKQTSRAKG